jgi:hypothetical protein
MKTRSACTRRNCVFAHEDDDEEEEDEENIGTAAPGAAWGGDAHNQSNQWSEGEVLWSSISSAARHETPKDVDEDAALLQSLYGDSVLGPMLNEGDECIVCMNARKKWVCFPCGHLTLCDGCAGVYERDFCPTCRQQLEGARLVPYGGGRLDLAGIKVFH